MSARELLLLRLTLAAVWLYNGLYLKLWLVDPEHLQVVQAVGDLGPLSPAGFLTLIGADETLLGLGILSGWQYRFASLFQFSLIVLMNAIGILSGGVDKPLALIITNLPLLVLIWVGFRLGPGSWRP